MTDLLPEREFDVLVDYLKRNRGFDFNAYKRPSLMRRVQNRMQTIGIDRFADYTDYLEVHPDEFEQLFNVILINVTSFFRDEPSWTYLRDEVLPSLLASRPQVGPLRVWSAGCASGEETYSIAMLLAEALGRDEFHERVKIYATDIDEHALAQARAATYNQKQVEGVPPALLDTYFSREGEQFVFDKALRRSVIFGRHDLILDAPISRVSVLICRNTLMYFNTEAQGRILARFHFALTDPGVLFLGKAEMLLTHAQLFAPIDLRYRTFRKVSKDHWRDRLAVMNQANGDAVAGGAGPPNGMYPTAFDASPHAQFVIDPAGRMAFFNDRARALFNIVPTDIGRPIQDLDLSYRPLDLRSPIQQALEQHAAVTIKDLAWEIPGQVARYFDVHVVPLTEEGGRPIGVSVSLTDVSRLRELQSELHRSKQELETAYEELQSTNEELETTNEELQSTVE